MSVLVSVIILFLAMLIQAFMQLSPGIFALFYHYALGKKSRKKADDLSPYYVLGYELFIAAVFFILCIFIFTLDYYSFINFQYLSFALAGIFIAEAFVSLFFYYRKGKTTALFLSRKFASTIEHRAKNIKTKPDAFILGFLSSLPELIFTLPLYLAVIIALLDFTILPRSAVLIFFLLISLMPLFWIFGFYHTDHHFANLLRLRLKLKPVVKTVFFLCFLSLSAIIIFGALNYGR